MSVSRRTLGIDLSLTKAGFVVLSDNPGETWRFARPPRGVDGIARIIWWRESTVAFAREHNVRNIALEDYAFSARGAKTHETGELGGVVRIALLEAGCTIWLVNPSTLKKLGTGKGNASKDIVVREVFRRWGFEARNQDLADAFVLAKGLQNFLRGEWQRKDDAKTWSKAKRLDPIVRRRRR